MTRTSHRWATRIRSVEGQWRNLHHASPTRVVVHLAESGAGRTTLSAEWDADTPFDGPTVWVQRPGARREPADALGWGTRGATTAAGSSSRPASTVRRPERWP